MARWRPDARDRLETAAVELFLEQGFDEVTVPHITARAGLTPRTFYRHFADKREVLFADADRIPALAAELVAGAPAGLAPVAIVARGLPVLAATAFEGRREQLQRRAAVISGNAGLMERELRKMDDLTTAIAAAFGRRGVDELTAAVVAEMSVAVVRSSIRSWMRSDGQQTLAQIMATSLQALDAAFEEVRPLPADGPAGAGRRTAVLPTEQQGST